MNQNSYIYSLRFTICPDSRANQLFEDLLGFCEQAKINDVMFFIEGEELNQGHPVAENVAKWLDMISGFQPRLAERGITTSVNPWTTTLHTDRGRTLKPGQDFTTMTDHNGLSCEAVACPLCPNWERYLLEMYAQMSSIHPDMIWVEDDFRLHNHLPLDWGGCFCDLHMAEFSRRAGKKLDRQEFYQAVTQPGPPHPYRKIWLDTNRETFVRLARNIEQAVHGVSPQTRIGLMSSDPSVHAAEGRDWQGILRALAGGHRPLLRPHLPAYTEGSSHRYCLEYQAISRLTAAVVPPDTQLWPELDNFPFTPFSKSYAFAAMELETSLTLGSEGITMSLFDMMGNGINHTTHYDTMLSSRKPWLEAVRSLKTETSQEQGVCVMVNPESSASLHSGQPGMQGLYPIETFWAQYLSAFGIANHYCLDPSVSGQLVAVSGQYFRGMTPQAIQTMFERNSLMLTGDAVEVLLEAGLGELVSASGAQRFPLNHGCQSYEEVSNGEVYQGFENARMSAQAMFEVGASGDWLCIEYSQNPDVIARLKTPDGTDVGPGMCVVNQKHFVLPYLDLSSSYTHLLNPVRQEIVQRFLERQNPAPVMLAGAPYLSVSHYRQHNRQVLLLQNFTSDVVKRPSLFVGADFGFSGAKKINRKTAKLEPIELRQQAGRLMLECDIAPLQTECLLFEGSI